MLQFSVPGILMTHIMMPVGINYQYSLEFQREENIGTELTWSWNDGFVISVHHRSYRMLLRNTKSLFSFDPFELIKSEELLSFHIFSSNFDYISSVLLFIKKYFLLATLDAYDMSVLQKMLHYFVAGLIIYSHVENKESCLLKINEIYHWLLFAEQKIVSLYF